MLGEIRDWLEELACRAGFDGLPSNATWLAVVVVGLAAVLGYVALRGSGESSAASPDAGVPSAAATATQEATSVPAAPASITVHVVGEVRRPGVYELPSGSRAADAVEAAGGLLGDADQTVVNLARVVMDGEQVSVPREGESVAGAPVTSAGGTGSTGGTVNLNTASIEQLDTLPGIGPSTAQKIVADRTANGPFRTVDDLMRVPGIGPAKFEALKDLVSAG